MRRGYLKLGVSIVWSMLLLGLFVSANGAIAQVATNKLSIELNSVKAVKSDCRITLVIRNGLESKIENLTLDLVLFDSSGTVAQSLGLNAGRLHKNKTRVHQFDLKSVSCDSITRVLINDILECTGKNLNTDFCLENLVTRSATKISLIQ